MVYGLRRKSAVNPIRPCFCGVITGDSIAYPAEGFKQEGAVNRTFMLDFFDFHTIFYEICILYCKNAYDIMPIGKKIMLFHSEQ